MQNDFTPFSPAPPATALIIGGGVVGLSIALNLQARGIATVLVDPGSGRTGASYGNAGHIAIEQVEPLASLATIRALPRRLFSRGGAAGFPLAAISRWLPFGLRLLAAARPARFARGKAMLTAMLDDAMGAWQRLLDRIGARELLLEQGHFIVWESPASAARGRAAWMNADTGTTRFRDATPEEIARLAAITSAPIAGAVRCLGSGQIADTGALLDRLAAAFTASGGVIRAATATAIDKVGDTAIVHLNDATRATADLVIVAGGAASGELLRTIGHKAPIIAERGYHIETTDHRWPAGLPPVVFEDRAMIVTGFASGLRAASFVEFARTDLAPDPRKWDRLRSHVAALGLPFALPGKPWIGARPTLPDYLPAIGRSDKAANLAYAFGHQHLGLTLAAITGEAVAALALGEQPPFDLTPLSLKRFEA